MNRLDDTRGTPGLGAVAAVVVLVALAGMILGNFKGDWRPSHFDEWRSLAMAQRALDSGSLVREAPTGSPNGLARDITDRNRSLGFVAVVAGWLKVTPDPIGHYKGLALAFLLLYAGGVYGLSRKVGVGHWPALIAVLGLGTLPTDTMLLGPALAVPSSLSLGVLCWALVAHLELSRSSSQRPAAWWALLAVSAGLLAAAYPLSLIVFAGLVALDCSARPGLLRERYIRWLAALGLAGGALFLANEWQIDAENTAEHLADLFLLNQRWHLVNSIVYTLDYMVPPALLGLALAGACISLVDRSRIWIAGSFLIPLLMLGGYHFFQQGIIIPYQRVGLFLGLGACLCAGVAVQRLLELLRSRRFPGWSQPLCIIAIALAVVLTPRPAPPFEHTKRRDRPGQALETVADRIAGTHSPPATIWAAPRDAMYLEALTGLRVPAVALDSLLTGKPPPPMDCTKNWDLVVGRCPCSGYSLAFVIGGVPVFTPSAAAGPAPH